MPSVPCVAIIVTNPAGQVLLNLRDDRLGLPFANCWTLPGGRVEAGETAVEAADRELEEETGLRMPLKFWRCYSRPTTDPGLIIQQHVYLGRIDSSNPALQVGEGQALAFFDSIRLRELSVGFGFDSLLREYFDQRPS
ncbi:MAG: NUDIX domain-containing protein [Anaerolineae bacterium]|jgi:8-oxo-dGTP diphosphatase|nr:NUDIX domain-containing protein [Anaerolineae bacterium]